MKKLLILAAATLLLLSLIVPIIPSSPVMAAPVFTEQTGGANPFNGVDVGDWIAPSFADIDSDGDMDTFIGEFDGIINYYWNTGTALAPAFTEQTGGDNPFNGVDVGQHSSPSFADIDGDGDMDAFIGEWDGIINYYKNTGTALAPVFTEQTGGANPFNGVDVGDWSAPSFADIDGDGDMDAFIGEVNGNINYYQNTGTALAPAFTEQTGANNPFNGVAVGGAYSTPTFVDIDGDGDRDAFIGQGDYGTINYYKNTGTALAPAFTAQTGGANPFNGVAVGTFSAPALADIDADGDMDAFIGEGDGIINYYQNTGDNTLAPAFTEQTGGANPFNGVDVGTQSAPAFIDIDGDGDMDAFIGEFDGIINYYWNTGTALAPVFTEQTGGANPFNGVDVGDQTAPAFIDIDGDGDMDAFIGEYDGIINYYRNTGTALAPAFSEQTGASNPFNGVDVGSNAKPTFVDIDGDGDMDAFIGELDGNIDYYRNTGTALAPAFTEQTGADNPFNGVDVGFWCSPTFADIDGDGDRDAFIGDDSGIVVYYKNTGTALAPVFTEQTGGANPFNGVDVEFASTPTFIDIDGDGDMDAFIGEDDGNINYYKNTGAPVAPEMDVSGNGNSIADGDTTPSATDGTDFGSADIATGTVAHTFTITNSGTAALNLTDPSPYVSISGANAADFSVTVIPSTPVAAGGGTTTFTITFNPSATGERTATLSIANDDSDENPYNFSINGTGTAPEMNLKHGVTDIADGGSYGFGSHTVGTDTDVVFTIENTGTANLTLTLPLAIGGADAGQFSIQAQPPTENVTASGSTTFTVRFSPTSAGAKSATIAIANNDSDENPYDLTITGTGTAVPPAPPSGGGSDYTYSNIDMPGKKYRLITDSIGKVYKSVEATSGDGMLTVNIPKGTVIKDKNRRAPHTLQVSVNQNPPPPPDKAYIIGLPYSFSPEGTTFNPPLNLTLKYDPASLPAGVSEDDLVIAYYDQGTGKWVECSCTCNPENNCLTASIGHFSTFAVVAYEPPPAPASFSLSNLSIQPTEVKPGETVTVTVTVANTGGTQGVYSLVLKVNGTKEATQEISVTAGGVNIVSFTINKKEAGTYPLDVNGLTGSFKVVTPAPTKTTPAPAPAPPPAELKLTPLPPPTITLTPEPPMLTLPVPPTPAPTTNWLLILGITGGVIIAGLLIFFLIRKSIWLRQGM